MNRINWLRLAQIVWIVLAVGYFSIWLVSVPTYYARVSTLTIEPFRLGERVIFANANALRDASQRGVSLETSAALDIGNDLLQILVYYITAALVFWRATSGFGWFTAFILMLMGVTNMSRAVGVAAPFPGALFLIEIPSYIVWPLWVLWLYLFPSGRPVPRWSWLLVSIMFILFMFLRVASLLGVFGIVPPQIDTIAATLGPVAALPIFGFVLLAQIYRYWKVSNVTERQQTKWFLFSVSMFFAIILLFALIPDLFRTSVVLQNLLAIAFLIFPISVALAILRYRLFDIDIIIRKTLVYSVLTILLALIYFGGVVLVQQLTRSFTETSDLAIVVSTLAVAALFFPLRRRVQNVIDKRFYRRKYDAAKTLAAFSATVRDEVELEKLTAELINVVNETVQPTRVSLWLKPTDDHGRSATP